MELPKINTLMYFSAVFMLTFDAYAQNSAIEEVIVSAEKRNESLQDVSISVTALTEDVLETKNITDFVGLSAIAPGVTVAKNEGYKTIISIRGVGDETNQNAIAAPSVALHMDGIFVASKFSLRTDFIDLESTCGPLFNALAPGIDGAERTIPGDFVRQSELGWLHCGPPGAGHFVKMVHNGVEYGIMQAYAEGFNILHEANAGRDYVVAGDAEVAPMEHPEDYCYDIDVPEVAELWRRGSVIGSWLLDLTATVLRNDRELSDFDGGVSDSGEGRWTVHAAVDLGVPAPVLSTALFARFESRRLGRFANRVLNGMRAMFGGHDVR